MPRDRQQHAHFRKKHDERRAAVAEERQADAGVRDGVCDNADVEDSLNAELERDAKRQHGAEAVTRMQRDIYAAPDEKRKQDNDDKRTDEAELLAHYGKNEVVLRLRDVEILLSRLPDADAEQLPGADGVK